MATPTSKSSKASYSLSLECPAHLVPDCLRPSQGPIPFCVPPPPPPPPPPFPFPVIPPPPTKQSLPVSLPIRAKDTKVENRRSESAVVTKGCRMNVEVGEPLWIWLKRPAAAKINDKFDSKDGDKRAIKPDVFANALFRARQEESLPEDVIVGHLDNLKQAACAYLKGDQARSTLPEAWCAIKLIACVGEEVVVHIPDTEDVAGKLIEFRLDQDSYTVFIQREEGCEPPVIPLEILHEDWQCGKGGVRLKTQEVTWRTEKLESAANATSKRSRRRSKGDNFARDDYDSDASYDTDFD